MDLIEESFESLGNGRDCLFRTDARMVIHATKVGRNKIVNRATGNESFTGQFHQIWEVDPRKDQKRKELASPQNRQEE